MNTGKDYIHRYWAINDRISVLQIKTEKSTEKKKQNGNFSSHTSGDRLVITRREPVDHLINIINIYAPTSEKVEKSKDEIEKIYTEVEKLLKKFKKNKASVTFVTGDFNAKVGKRQEDGDEERIMGRYSIGTRNTSGELFMDFCRKNEMFICNTAFQHPATHIATWTQEKVMKETNTVQRIHNQIDYILIDKNKKQNIRNSRIYAGTETYSDHRLLVAEFETDWVKLYSKINATKQPTTKRYNIAKLTTDTKTQEAYRKKLEEGAKLANTWDELSKVCKQTAEEILGFATEEKNEQIEDETLKKLSNMQKNVRMKMMKVKDAMKITKLRKERKQIKREMEKEIKRIREAEIDEIADEIEKVKDDARMFKAMKKVERKPFQNPVVHDSEGKNVTNPQELYEIVAEYFKQQFFDEGTEEVKRFVGEPRRLNRIITKQEVIKAITTMANRKAAGKDNLAVEILKYAPDIVFEKIAEFLNRIFEKQEDVDTGSGILVPLQKPPPKTKGPVKNLRPVNLLLVIRKILSKVALNRSQKKIDGHLSYSQSAYRKWRSTSDVVWAYRWLTAKIQEYNMTIYITGIDMSAAFDTISRHKLLEIAERTLSEDGSRMMRVLLSNTTVEVRIKGAVSKEFTSNIGSPQGDSYSGPQFTMYFEESLKEVRAETNITGEEDIPEEMIYADDYDHLTEELEKKTIFKWKVKDILGRSNLKVNEDKTEDTILRRAKHDKKNKETNEPWRNTIKLGSKLGDKEDIQRRKNLSTGKMTQMTKIIRKKKIRRIDKIMKLYNALVRSILLYNACTWGVDLTDEKNLNSFHRRQLRQVAGVFYPDKISNEKLYKLTKAKPISIEITRSRWKMFGHTLRMHEKTPARKAMRYFFQVPEGRSKFRGRKRSTIVTALNRDIIITRQHNPQFRLPNLKTELDLRNIRVKATNRKHWQKIVRMVTDAAYAAMV